MPLLALALLSTAALCATAPADPPKPSSESPVVNKSDLPALDDAPGFWENAALVAQKERPEPKPIAPLPKPKADTGRSVETLPDGKQIVFFHADTRKRRAIHGAVKLPAGIASPVLPIDSTGNATVNCPMDGNDQYGDCGEAMAAHSDNILTFSQGKRTQSSFDANALVKQYLSVSGGDYGLDENDVVNGIWKVGIAGNKNAVILDSLDIDMTDTATMYYCIDEFYTVQLGWMVPTAFVRGFQTGSVWSTGTPNRNNGHYTPLADVAGPNDTAGGKNINGYYRLWTWGGWAWVSPTFVKQCKMDGFVAFGTRQFDTATGLDSKGRHITIQAAKWKALGGNTIPASVLSQFPPVNPNPPTPVPPTPVPPTPVPPTPVPPTPIPPGPTSGDLLIDPVARTVTLPAGWTVKGETAESLRAELRGAGVSPNTILDVLQLVADVKAKKGFNVILADVMKIIQDVQSSPTGLLVPRREWFAEPALAV